jgi:nucleotide-binding universal stress UspA family protein
MKILCPTDFSSASVNAVEYAAKYAQQTGATLTLMHVQPVYMSEGVSYFSGGDRESITELKQAADQLKDICESITSVFNVPCSFENVPSVSHGIEKTISIESEKYDLTIIGTNGADKMSEFYFGSHSFRIAKKESGPVLIVPEECAFNGIQNVAFASDCHIGDTMLLKQLKNLTDAFKPMVRVVHISEKDTDLSREVYKAFCSLTEETLNYEDNITFERIIHDNKTDAIESFVNKTHADLLALYMEKHCLLHNVFHESIVKKLTSYASFPILVFHK